MGTFSDLSEQRQERRYDLDVFRGQVQLSRQIYGVHWGIGEPWIDWERKPAARGYYGSFLHYGGKTRLGFGAHSWGFRGGGSGGDEKPHRESNVIFPLWSAAVVLGIAPLLWARGIWRRTRGVRAGRLGLCARCGYDMRASRDRCPECGEAIVVAGPSRLRQSSWRRELWPIPVAAVLLGALGAGGLWAAKREIDSKRAQWMHHEQVKEATEKAFTAAGAEDEQEFARQVRAGAKLPPARAGEEMFIAIQNYKPRLAAVFLEAGADVHVNDGQAIAQAAANRYFFLVMRLAERGADVNVKDPVPVRAALHYCAAELADEDQLEVVRVLLDRGADLNATDSGGNTPLHLLSESNNESLWDRVSFARLLIARGANVNTKNTAGKTPLALAKERERDSLASFLAHNGAH